MRFSPARQSTPNGPTLSVAAGDRAPAITFVHGVARRWQTFRPLLPLLPADWAVSGVDLRGHGESDRAERYLVADYARDLLHLVRSGPTPTVLYGSSLGALVAVWVAAECPRAVRGIVLEDPPSPEYLAGLHRTTYHPTFRAMHSVAGRTEVGVAEAADTLARAVVGELDGRPLTLGDLRDPVSLRFTARCLRDVDPAVFTPLLEGRWLDGADWWSMAGAVKCPTLLLHGDCDHGGMLTADDAVKLAAAVPDLVRVHCRGLGHVLHWQDPVGVAKAAVAFMESL